MPHPQNSPLIGVISDDMTGAGGAAARLAARGLRAEVAWRETAGWGKCDAVVADTRGRDRPEAADERAEAWGRSFRQSGVAHIAMRVDTTLRGQPADELAGYLRGLAIPDPVLIAMPAHPTAGRVTFDGIQMIRDHGGSQDSIEVAPVIFGSRAAAIVHHPTVTAGPSSVAEYLSGHLQTGIGAFVIDCSDEGDFQVAARAVATLDLRDRLVAISSGPWLSYLPTRLRDGFVLCIVASPTDANRAQLDHIQADDPEAVVTTPEAAIADPAGTLATAPSLVVIETLTEPGPDPSARAAEAAHHLLSAGDRRCDGIVVSGGQAASAVADRLEATAFEVVAEPRPLCTLGYLVGGRSDGLAMVTKGGRIGDEKTLTALVSAIRGEALDTATVPA